MMDERLISTRDRPGAYDAIETAKPDEPLFPIQGGDPFGPPTVLHWASLARARALTIEDAKAADRLLRKASEAEQIAWAMQEYQRGHVADPEPTKPTSYTGHTIELTEQADQDRKMREARIRGADRLHNLIGQGTEVAEALERLGCCEPEIAALRNALGQISAAASAIEPRRANERS